MKIVIEVNSCCFCVKPVSGILAMGIVGAVFSLFSLVPISMVVNDIDFYVDSWIDYTREHGNNIPDEATESIHAYMHAFLAFSIAFHCLFLTSSLLLTSSALFGNSNLSIPWLVIVSLHLVLCIVLLLGAMLAVSWQIAILLAFLTLPFLAFEIHCLLVVGTVYRRDYKARAAARLVVGAAAGDGTQQQQPRRASLLRRTEVSGSPDLLSSEVTQSASTLSFNNVKGSLSRIVGGTPPPPYETVANLPDAPKNQPLV